MTEPAVKTRVVTKVRRQFLHKRPPGDDEVAENANMVATPEQLNENATRMLESSLGLVEINRNIYAGHQFMNLNYKISNIKVENHFQSQTVTMDIQSNDIEILPWEYCAERLESYGDLELATWANRLRTHRKNYTERMDRYFQFAKSTDPEMVAAMEQGQKEAKLACQDIESKYVYRKLVLFGSRDSVVPLSLTIHEGLLNDIGQNVDSFVKGIKKHGIPGLFKRDCKALIEQCKRSLAGGASGGKPSFVQERPESIVDIYDKKDNKKAIRVKTFVVTFPTAEGTLMSVYLARLGPVSDAIPSKSDEDVSVSHDKKAAKSEPGGMLNEDLQ